MCTPLYRPCKILALFLVKSCIRLISGSFECKLFLSNTSTNKSRMNKGKISQTALVFRFLFFHLLNCLYFFHRLLLNISFLFSFFLSFFLSYFQFFFLLDSPFLFPRFVFLPFFHPNLPSIILSFLHFSFHPSFLPFFRVFVPIISFIPICIFVIFSSIIFLFYSFFLLIFSFTVFYFISFLWASFRFFFFPF